MTKSWYQHSKVAPKAERTGQDGFVYDSKTEYQRYCYLNLMARAGEITNLERQVKYELYARGAGGIGEAMFDDKRFAVMVGPNCDKIAVYTPDFVYHDKWGKQIIEDVKGYRDEASKFRIRVFEALYGVKVTIVKKSGKNWVSE